MHPSRGPACAHHHGLLPPAAVPLDARVACPCALPTTEYHQPDGGREDDAPVSRQSPPLPAVTRSCWQRVFPGRQRELSELRRWLSLLLPDCPARDDVLSVATELGGNAIQHTASGRDGGWFAVEVAWHQSAVWVAVVDRGGSAEPRVIDDPDGERGRGLLLVRGLSLRTGFTGDQRGRLVWAQIAWPDPNPAATEPPPTPYQAAVGNCERALRFIEVLDGCSTAVGEIR